jgi:hypothetical protein
VVGVPDVARNVHELAVILAHNDLADLAVRFLESGRGS